MIEAAISSQEEALGAMDSLAGSDGSASTMDGRQDCGVAPLTDQAAGNASVADGGTDDLLSSLVQTTTTDPGAPFAPEYVTALASLKKTDRSRFESLRVQLRQAGCRVSELDRAIAEEGGEGSGRGVMETETLLEVANEAELFHAPDGTPFADLQVNGHRETWQIASRGFNNWLSSRYYEVAHGAPSSIALRSVLRTIEAKAQYDAPERTVHVRVAGNRNSIYLDLCDEDWRAVEISAGSWRVVEKPPVRFRRASGMQSLPTPAHDGSLVALRPFVNVKSQADFVLVVSWLLAALRNVGPYPLLVLSGEQGSAKSTFTAMLRSLVDPNAAPLRALPREERDLFVAANNGHVLAFDNVSGLPSWTSDTLCRLATGGAYAARRLYSDDDETLFEAQKPMILNGITDFVTRSDLADRAVFLTLEPIPDDCRQPERELWDDFNALRPRILGALLDGVAMGLRRLPHMTLESLPRMADFALWAAACELAFWPQGTFETAYRGNRNEAVDNVIDADIIASAIRTLLATVRSWKGTASDLLAVLQRVAGQHEIKSNSWPRNARVLADRLRRSKTFLRLIGIQIDFRREGRNRERMIHIVSTASSTSASSASVVDIRSSSKEVASPGLTPAKTAESQANGGRVGTVMKARINALKSSIADVAYGADATLASTRSPIKPLGIGWLNEHERTGCA